MKRVAPFSLAYIYAISVAIGIEARGVWLLLPILLTFVVIPLADTISGSSMWNPPADKERTLLDDARYRWITWAWVPIGIGVTLWALFASSDPGWSLTSRIALAIGVGLMNGAAGIVYAHELVHQPTRLERLLGEALLTLVSYAHFRVEHVFGHHRYVATPRDPATARYGENFYAFFFRSVSGQVRSAWMLETKRLQRAGKRVLSARNRMLMYSGATVALFGAIFYFAGSYGVVFLAAQSVVAFGSLELINYLEHYGLLRRETAPGQYEPVRPYHSWNSGYRVSNWALINLGRHSDHHAAASRRYQIRRTFDAINAPQLPAGYAKMYMLALLPPLWFRVMNPRVDAWRERFYATS